MSLQNPIYTISYPYGQKALDYDASGNLIYFGKHADEAALLSDLDWIVTKLTWASGNLTKIQTMTGAWSSRTILAW